MAATPALGGIEVRVLLGFNWGYIVGYMGVIWGYIGDDMGVI